MKKNDPAVRTSGQPEKQVISLTRRLAFYTREPEPRQLMCQAIDAEHGGPLLIVNPDPEGSSGLFADGFTCEAYELDRVAVALSQRPKEGLEFRCSAGRACGRLVAIDLRKLEVEIIPDPDLDVRVW